MLKWGHKASCYGSLSTLHSNSFTFPQFREVIDQRYHQFYRNCHKRSQGGWRVTKRSQRITITGGGGAYKKLAKLNVLKKEITRLQSKVLSLERLQI